MHVSSGVRVHGAGKSTNLLTEMETCSAERKEKQKRNGTKCHRNSVLAFFISIISFPSLLYGGRKLKEWRPFYCFFLSKNLCTGAISPDKEKKSLQIPLVIL